MQPWRREGAVLVSPSVAQGPHGEGWLETFLKQCPPKECEVDAIALHWYEGAHQIEYFKQYFTDAWNKPAYHKLPIYVNEFGPTSGTIEEKAAFVKAAVEWMDQQGFIIGYAVGPCLLVLLNEHILSRYRQLFWTADAVTNGRLNAIGLAYIDA